MALAGIKLSALFTLLLPLITARLIDNLVTIGPTDVIHVNAGAFEREFHDEFAKYERDNVTTSRLNEMIRLFSDSLYKVLIVDDIPNARNPQLCLKCRAVTYTFLGFNATGADDESLERIANDLCLLLKLEGTEAVCRDTIATFKPTMLYILRNTGNTLPDRICGILYQSFNCGSIEDLYEEFPVTFQRPTHPRNTSSKATPAHNHSDRNLTILHLTDFHYDPLYAVGSAGNCKEGICCRGDRVAHDGAGFWGDYRGCDSPWHTLKNVVQEIKRRYSKIDMIYFTGDIIDHFKWATSVAGNKESITNLTQLFKSAFPGIPLYPVLGNHESHPANTFAPSSVEGENISSQWLYEHVADIWSDWLPRAALETLREAGYYTVKLYNGLRIVAINNNFCYHTNVWLLHNTTYFAQQLEWLQEVLQRATTAREKVHIISHIPANERDCFGPWAREYRKLVEKFSPIISGIFNGHTHEDEFNVFYSKSDPSKALNVAWNGGSATTFAYFNSNFRMYYADLTNFEVLDYDTWWYNLTEANLTPTRRPTWHSYSFAREYGLKSLSPASVDKLVRELAADKNKLLSYWKRKVKYSDAQLSQGCDDDCLTDTLCDIVFVEHGDNVKCEELLKIFYS
ncbi:sphingomyelin phosphodiesterase-like [Phlebotomus argentipes]|uniref:sphingomyelin phosphodiesterase-like n=1 Tax=Phlebotomus argentipes TaxID=94469 RepID=UPI00289343B2|nr:sphingomyelin phosphodiesterase-like [Phlebotomus argentipes]